MYFFSAVYSFSTNIKNDIAESPYYGNVDSGYNIDSRLSASVHDQRLHHDVASRHKLGSAANPHIMFSPYGNTVQGMIRGNNEFAVSRSQYGERRL